MVPVIGESRVMDQSELNVVIQRWLESLLHPPETQENPGPLAIQPGAQDLTVVLDKLRHLMKLGEVPKTSLRAGGTHLAVLARSVMAYLNVSLESGDLDKVSKSLTMQTTRALMAIFKFTGKKLTPLFHDDPYDGIVRAAQMALFTKYEKYAIKGSTEFSNSPPVFYISDSGRPFDCQVLCGKLGIPLSSCSLIKCKAEGTQNTMDTVALDFTVEQDISSGRIPVMVIAYAGTPLSGHVEDMAAIREICNRHKVWMHVQGHGLSSLCLPVEDEAVALCREADSLVLSPGTWFGLLSCPYLTLHRTPYIIEPEQLEDEEEFPPKDCSIPDDCIPVPRVCWNGLLPSGLNRMLSLSLWLCIQYLGTSTLVDTVSYCSSLTKRMIAKLEEIPGVKRFDIPSHPSFTVLFKYFGGGEVEFSLSPPSSPSEDAAEPGVTGEVPTDGQTAPSAESADGEPRSEAKEEQETAATPPEEEGEVESSTITVEELAPATANIANALIARDLQCYFAKVGVTPLKLEHCGICFKFDPVNSFPEHSTSIEDIDRFIEALKQRVQTLHTTALVRRLIESQLKGQPNLRCLEFPSFFAAGFVQYVPTDWALKTELTLDEVSELNTMNIELAGLLGKKNPAFTPFQHGNFSCIMIKELQSDINVQEFVLELLEETRMYENNKKFLAGMSEKIVQGIEAAESDLSKEKEKKSHEEGYLKYVPIVGSVLSWFTPSTPTTPEGRTFNLSSGKVETTTSTYKYKMQVQGEDSAPSTPSKPQQLLSLDGAKPHSVLQLPEQTHLQVNDDGPQQQEVASTQLNTSTQSSSASQEVGGRDEKETEIGAPISETDAAS